MSDNSAGRRPLVVDAHEDIAYNALCWGRNYGQSAAAIRRAEANSDVPQHNGRATVGLPDWLAGRVAVVFGTLFVLPQERADGPWELQTYRDAEEAYRRAGAQLDYYHRFADEHEQVALIATRADLEKVLDTWQGDDESRRQVGILPLMEGADPIRAPKEAEEWYERGIRIVGLSWSATRYAGGTRAPGGLTTLGHELLEVLASTGMVVDMSHLAEQSFFEVLDRYPGRLIASHANPRALAGEESPDRHLSDSMMLRLAERDGVQGIVPLNPWLRRDYTRTDTKDKVTLEHLVAAIDYVCQLVGDARHVGLGSDFDGGFGAEVIPAEIDTVADLAKIAPALAARGYAPDDVAAVMGANWLRLLRETLP